MISKKSCVLGFSTILLTGALFAATDVAPVVPMGTISVDRAVALAGGSRPNLTWAVTYPQSIPDVVDVGSDGSLHPTASVKMKVKVLGLGMVSSDGKTWGNAKISYSTDGSNWTEFFNNTDKAFQGSAAKARDHVWTSKDLAAGSSVYFKFYCTTWGKFNVITKAGLPNLNCVVALVNGSKVPDVVVAGNAGQAGMVEAWLKPYLVDGVVSIGPKDVIYLAEVTATDPAINAGRSDKPFDMQDVVIICTME